MAIAFIQEFTIQDRSTTNYDAISEGVRRGLPAERLIIRTAGFDDDAGVFRVFDVWETRSRLRHSKSEWWRPERVAT
jgi:hypothetical protein